MKLAHTLLALLVPTAALASSWSKEDHEIFRLKDEVEATEGKINFYEFLNAPSIYATQDELNKAYRRTSRQIHPDKFIPPSHLKKAGTTPTFYPPKSTYVAQNRQAADERFARLGLVANILRGPGRERYDHFLRNGFPRWRGTGYYYSRFRPGLTPVLIGLWIVVAGGGHYLVMHVNYAQQRRFMERYISDARVAAWGNNNGLANLNIDALAGDSGNRGGTPPPATGNRKQRRAAKAAGSGSNTPPPVQEKPQHVAKRKVTSENGKVFMVTSLGDVSLMEEDEDGVMREYLLDLDEIPKANWRRTAMVTLPMSLYNSVVGRILPGKAAGAGTDMPEITIADGEGAASVEELMERKGLKKRTKAGKK
ncbi:hypothetical protein DRE_01276 [Drechslerella stenobrocha 248]|uniref:J domain-containing protein n=1 Tax=Drechslerella stenobrocha 248 TaxID=1043628 RepID=W7HLH3_9PEZI|nr:hypothetical protein DRE_01276 [Drechslerella stenobrocha 248]